MITIATPSPTDHRLTRRRLLAGLGAATLAGCAAPARAPALTESRALHLADRLTWGADDASVQALRAQGWHAWVRAQLRPAPAQLPAEAEQAIAAMTIMQRPLDQLLAQQEQMRREADVQAGEDQRKAAREAYQHEQARLQREAATRHLLRAVHSPNQLHEQMTWFWLNHFSVFAGKADLRAMLGDYEELALRPQALGRFRDLLGAVVRHPAMLRYLDNAQNAAGHINENFARELMELHTLGVDGGYGQADVQELARLLTGAGIGIGDRPPPARPQLRAWYVRQGAFEFHPARHDFGPKQLLGAPIRARGLAEIDEALDRLARHPSTARHLARKLALWWMQDEPPQPLVDAVAASFQRSDGSIAATLETLLLSPQFEAGRKFKDPMRYVVSSTRLVAEGRVVRNAGPALFWLQRLGEPLYGRLTPDGWPLEASAWNSAGQLAARFEFARAMGAGGQALFRAEGTPAERVPPERIAPRLYAQALSASLGPATRSALAQAGGPAEWNGFLLAAPELMQR